MDTKDERLACLAFSSSSFLAWALGHLGLLQHDDDASSDSTASTKATDDSTTSDADETDATKPPAINPVVDDITKLFDDDVVAGNSTAALLPAEKEEPESWPVIVTGIFLLSAITLIGATCYKMYRKRSTYTEVPSVEL